MLQHLADDIRYGVRILTNSPGLSATAALLVALVVGGNATIYSMVNGVIHQPAPAVTATDLVSFGQVGRPGDPYIRYADFQAYAAQTTSLRSLAAWGFGRTSVATPNGTYLLQPTPVTANYFETIGIAMARGRSFTAEDDRAGAPLVAVISDGLWSTHFGAASDAIGRTVTIGDRSATVVGIAPPRFSGPSSGEWSDLWVPLHASGQGVESAAVAMIGRLAAGSSVARVRSEFSAMQARLNVATPATGDQRRWPVLVTEYAASAGGFVPAFQREILAIFSIVTLLTLLVVCANVANLMLARAVVRQRETAVRQSLGASRLRIVRLVAIEGLTIAAVACVLALMVATWAASLIPALLPQGRTTMPMVFTPDWRVALYAGVLTLIGTVGFSLVPALRTWRQDPLPILKDGGHTAARGRSPVSNALVVLQLAFSVLLLTGAGLAYRSGSLMRIDLGFDTSNILLTTVGTPSNRAAADPLLLDRIRERLATQPGVIAVSHVGGRATSWDRGEVRAAATGEPAQVSLGSVGTGYLEMLGLAPVAGRAISRADRARTDVVAMINQQLALALFADRNPVGATLLVGPDRRPVEIVGVAPNAYYRGFNPERPDQATHYVFLSGHLATNAGVSDDSTPISQTTFYMRYRGSPESLIAAVPGALRDVDLRIALSTSKTMASQLEELSISARLVSLLLGIFAGLSLLIAAIGQYAVMTFNMRRRTRDFGVRIALGASARQIVTSALREGANLTVIGLLAGFALSAAVATGLSGLLFGITPTDGPTYGSVFALLASVSLFASYLPARRASRIDPIQALRQD